MKKFILATMMVLGMASMASAQTVADGKNYFTLSGGQVRDSSDERTSYGFAAGREFNPVFRLEAAYDYYDANSKTKQGQTLVGNAIGQYKIPGTIFVPYALVGAGYGWDTFGNRAIYNIGAGVRAEVTKNVDLDLRYKRVGNFDNVAWNNQDSVVTAGVSFKF
jgi:opacity protein-like surface antigen